MWKLGTEAYEQDPTDAAMKHKTTCTDAEKFRCQLQQVLVNSLRIEDAGFTYHGVSKKACQV